MPKLNDIDLLIAKLRTELDEIDLSQITPSTVILDIEGWNSLYSLVVMALLSTEYGVDLPAERMRVIRTIQDLYDVIRERQAA